MEAKPNEVPPKRGCMVVPAQERYEGKQQLSYVSGLSAESVGSTALCMHLLTIPPGGRGRAHLHRDHESAVYILSGRAGVWSGEGLKDYMEVDSGNFVYIPAGEPHMPVNLSATEPVKAILARTDPNEQESVELLPELDNLPHTR